MTNIELNIELYIREKIPFPSLLVLEAQLFNLTLVLGINPGLHTSVSDSALNMQTLKVSNTFMSQLSEVEESCSASDTGSINDLEKKKKKRSFFNFRKKKEKAVSWPKQFFMLKLKLLNIKSHNNNLNELDSESRPSKPRCKRKVSNFKSQIRLLFPCCK